ncbi:MAG: hypothetical protein AB7L91_18395 [Dehalococcoidia bacterium]
MHHRSTDSTETGDNTKPTPLGDTPTAGTVTARFLEFHRQNPHVYTTLRDLAREWRGQGKTECGVALLYNVARWRLSLRTHGDLVFKLNDHFQPYYSRALMHFEPDLDGMFETRAADEADAWIESLKDGAA